MHIRRKLFYSLILFSWLSIAIMAYSVDDTLLFMFLFISFFVICIIGTLDIEFFPKANTFSQNDPRLATIKQIERTSEGRFLCPPDKRRKNYYAPSKKFYIFRKGERLPDHLVLVRVPDSVIVSFTNDSRQENKEKARIDLLNLGFNALIDCTTSMRRINHINQYKLRGRPALIVSKNYPGNIDLLEELCSDNFDRMIYAKTHFNQDP